MSFSQLNFLASAIKDGSIIPPRRRRTRCSVDSERNTKSWETVTHSHTIMMTEFARIPNYMQFHNGTCAG